MKPLTVYKASAGSGKTFRLAVEYVSLVVKNPDAYRNILAVTFTNKATAEMKQRILFQLYGIAHSLPTSEKCMDEVRKNVDLPDNVIRQRAATALSRLTHNYNYFRVQTIDAFFQTVLRNLARELNLTANLRVAIEANDIEELAVNQMIRNLAPNDKLLKWLGEFIQSKMDNNQSWNVFSDIKEFGKYIFNEYYQLYREQMNEQFDKPGFFERLRKQLTDMKEQALTSASLPYQYIMDELANEGFDDTTLFSKSTNELEYCREGAALATAGLSAQREFMTSETTTTRRKHMEKGEAWTNSKRRNEPEARRLMALADEKLCAMMRDAEENRWKEAYWFFSAVLTLKNLNQLRLLRSIEQAVDEQNSDANRFVLGNTQMFLNGMIADSDTPFIYEKIGTQLKHIMIDEFQDTSKVQWKNFQVLLRNCMAQEDSHSLIVGDVKQSIYRWRNGDWTQLNNMREDDQTHVEPMKSNFRSSHHIVEFNNAFILAAAEAEAAALNEEGIEQAGQLAQAYKEEDTAQTPENTELSGRVEVQLFDSKDEEYKEQTLSAMAEHINKLLSQGVKAHQIAILVRENKLIPEIASYFAHKVQLPNNTTLVSDQAFRLDASVAVQVIIHVMRVLVTPNDPVALATLVKLYQRGVLGADLTDADLFVTPPPAEAADNPQPVSQRWQQWLPEAFNKTRGLLRFKPLLDLIDCLISMFKLQEMKGQTAYLCAFRDRMAQFLDERLADMAELLDYWDETLHKTTIQSDDTDGIRIQSIHGSKGLEYPHLLLPFCDWRLELANTTFWCHQQHEEPFCQLPIAPIDFSAKLTHSAYAKDYREEHFQNIVDNLNLLYVAFTRAGRSLFITGHRHATKGNRDMLFAKVFGLKPKDEKNKKTKNPEQTALETSFSLPGSHIEEADDVTRFTYGDYVIDGKTTEKKPKKKDIERNVFKQKPIVLPVAIQTFDKNANFRQSNRSRDFVKNDEQSEGQGYIERGNILHEIFSHIRTLDDVEPAIAQLTIDGIVADNAEQLADLRAQVAKCMEQPEAREWFSPRWTLYNECTILETDNEGITKEHRPDRVMTDGQRTIVVDFKFGHPHAKYHEQVNRYVRLLQQMGTPNVTGWLWYVTLGRAEQVMPDHD